MDAFLAILIFVWFLSSVRGERPRALPATPHAPGLHRPAGSPYAARVASVSVEPVARVGRRTGVKVHAYVTVQGARGIHMDYEVRFRLPSGVAVRSRASRYLGAGDDLVARARTKPIQNDLAHYPDLWVFVPFGAVDLPVGVHDLVVTFDVAVDGQRLHDARDKFLLAQPEGDPVEPVAPASPDEFAVVAAGASTGSQCPMCSETVTGESFVCPRCETLHHLDCWRYNQGCTTYGCAGES